MLINYAGIESSDYTTQNFIVEVRQDADMYQCLPSQFETYRKFA